MEKEFDSLLKECVAETDSDIMLINCPMQGRVDEQLREMVHDQPSKKSSVILILVTEGGLADVAYRAAKILQANYETVKICIPGWCKSAGTLLAIGAHELIIGDKGELGPLDVQVAVRDEIGDRNSGLILESAIESLRAESFKLFEDFMMEIKKRSGNAVTFRTAADLSVQLTVGLMKPIFKQIDPVKLGDDARSQKIGYEYGVRLNMHSDNLKAPEALEMLLRGYPSHSFVVNRTEASWLFKKVKPIDGSLKAIIEVLGPAAVIPSDEDIVCYLTGESDVEEPANDENGELREKRENEQDTTGGKRNRTKKSASK